ncbi:MAG: hypothetical protein WDM92_01035 [Caulobacteraceae bacterium]
MTARLVRAALIGSALLAAGTAAARAQPAAPKPKTYEVEWVYRVKYGFQDEWWRIFQKYQIAILDREKQLGYVLNYTVTRPGLHVSEDSRWDYRIVITYPNPDAETHEEEVARVPVPRHRRAPRRREPPLGADPEPLGPADPRDRPPPAAGLKPRPSRFASPGRRLAIAGARKSGRRGKLPSSSLGIS